MPTRILLVGAGSIGAFFGSRLSTISNVLVSALCRSNYDAVRQHGFQISSTQFGDSVFRPENTFRWREEAAKKGLKFDFVIVATKALPDVGDDSGLLDGLVKDGHTSIVLIQNGLGIEEPFRKRFPRAPILSGVTIASCAQPRPGHIQHNRWTKTSIGPYFSSEASQEDVKVAKERTETFISLLKDAGISDAESYTHSGIQFVRWHKVAINAAMNPTSVLSGGAGNQEVGLDGDLYEHAQGVMYEVLSVAANVVNKPVPMRELKLATPEQILGSVKKNTSGSRPSMWQDWEMGNKMELEVILGNPIRMAKEIGLKMPRCQSMYALLKTAQKKRESKL